MRYLLAKNLNSIPFGKDCFKDDHVYISIFFVKERYIYIHN